MGTKPKKPAAPPPELSSTPTETELAERWSVQRKAELVLRLLRGEALDAVSRESRVPAHELIEDAHSLAWRLARDTEGHARGCPPQRRWQLRERRGRGPLPRAPSVLPRPPKPVTYSVPRGSARCGLRRWPRHDAGG
jgi:hypothetical protein